MKPSTRKTRKHGGIVNSLLYILLLPVYLLGKVFPRNSRLAAFGSGHGDFFMDNPKYFFLYCADHLEHTRCVFISKDREVVRQLNQAGYWSYYKYSTRGLFTALRAGKCFISHSTHDINALLIGGAEKIQLWHGTPLKHIGHDVLSLGRGFKQKFKNGLRMVLFRLFPYLNASLIYDKIIISSESIKASFKTAFHAADDEIIIAGQPRNDALTDGYTFRPEIFPEMPYLEQLRREHRHIITWMPTHRLRSRRGTVGLLDDFAYDPARLEQILKQYGAVLVIKVHFLDSPAIIEKFRDCPMVRIYPHPDPYPLLRHTDILITDYSSVFFDFLLLNRPIIFTPFDYDEYIRRDAPFYYDYKAVTPGKICGGWPEVLDALQHHLSCRDCEQEDSFAHERAKICRQFNSFTEGFSERVATAVFKQ